jgi:carboxymethylenebutenolidase
MLEDFIAAYEFLKNHPDCDGNVGVVGFCFGGWISNMMAVRIPDLKAAVPYYGGQPEAADVAQIQAPLLVIYAALDERVNAGWPAYEAALKEFEVMKQLIDRLDRMADRDPMSVQVDGDKVTVRKGEEQFTSGK